MRKEPAGEKQAPAATPALAASPGEERVWTNNDNSVLPAIAEGVVGSGGETVVAQSFAGSGVAGREAAAGGNPAESGQNDNIEGIINAFLVQIEKRKEYPYIARRRNQEGTVTVTVRLTAAGELAGEQVIRSSGVPALDEAALALVRKACPFPHSAGRSIAMNIPISYRLE